MKMSKEQFDVLCALIERTAKAVLARHIDFSAADPEYGELDDAADEVLAQAKELFVEPNDANT